jgi:hypothetical protein
MTLVQTVDGIGINERERDIECGDELEAKAKRLLEIWEINPTKTNYNKYEQAYLRFHEHIDAMNIKYGIVV